MNLPLPSRPRLARLAAFAWMLALAGCEDAPALTEPPDEASTAVEIERVVAREVKPVLRVPGLVEAKARIALAFRVAGFIERFEVDEGDPVQRGDVLAVLDRADFEREARTAAAALTRARAHARDARQTFGRQERYRRVREAEFIDDRRHQAVAGVFGAAFPVDVAHASDFDVGVVRIALMVVGADTAGGRARAGVDARELVVTPFVERQLVTCFDLAGGDEALCGIQAGGTATKDGPGMLHLSDPLHSSSSLTAHRHAECTLLAGP